MPQQQNVAVALLGGGPITRAAAHAAASTSQCGGAPSTSAPAAGDSTGYGGGKRRSGSGGGGEDPMGGGGQKKNRSTFGDITNAGAHPGKQPSPARCAEISRAQQQQQQVGGNQQHGRSSLPASSSGRNAAAAAAVDPSAAAAGCSSSSSLLPFLPPRPTVDPIDAGDVGDTLACVDYVQDIMESLYDSERRSRPATCYLEAVQTEVNASMRGILVDWLVEVAAEFRLVSDTLFSAVGYVDRVLSLRPVPRARLQLVGVACMLLAAKYEEIYAPQVDEFVFITDNTYSRDELLNAEAEALGDLRFSLSAPTAKTFLRRFVKAALSDGLGSPEADAKLPPLAAYVCELALLEYDAVAFLPSQVAAASVVVARHVLGSEAVANAAASAKGSSRHQQQHQQQQMQQRPAALWSPALARSYGAREGSSSTSQGLSAAAPCLLPPPPFSLVASTTAAAAPSPSSSPPSSPLSCPSELLRPVALLHGALCRAKDGPLPAVRDKYGAAAYRCVAAMPPPPPLPAEF